MYYIEINENIKKLKKKKKSSGSYKNVIYKMFSEIISNIYV